VANLHVIITKEFTFRGNAERFSNGYTFQSSTTTANDPVIVAAVAAALINMEKYIHASNIHFVYANGGPWGQPSCYVEEFAAPVAGTKTPLSTHPETCVLAQARLGRRRYLTKYYHTCAYIASGQPGDVVPAAIQSEVTSALANLTNGSLPSGLKACSNKDNAFPEGPYTCDPFFRTHQLKARGKRPTPG
jgi:hypothetical protein